MKRALLFFVLGFVVACSWFTNKDQSQSNIVKASREDRLALVSDIFTEWSTDVKSWFSNSKEVESDEISVKSNSLDQSNYEEALNIVSELLQDIGGLLTPEQKNVLEEGMNQLYRESILKEYGTSSEIPMFRE